MSDEASIREALIFNQAEAVRAVMDRDERIRELESERDALAHTVQCYRAEIRARAAAQKQMRELLTDLELELQATRYGPPRPAQDRLNEDGERTYALNLPEAEDYEEDDKDLSFAGHPQAEPAGSRCVSDVRPPKCFPSGPSVASKKVASELGLLCQVLQQAPSDRRRRRRSAPPALLFGAPFYCRRSHACIAVGRSVQRHPFTRHSAWSSVKLTRSPIAALDALGHRDDGMVERHELEHAAHRSIEHHAICDEQGNHDARQQTPRLVLGGRRGRRRNRVELGTDGVDPVHHRLRGGRVDGALRQSAARSW